MMRISCLLAAAALAGVAVAAPLTPASANDAATTELSAQERQRQQRSTTRTTTRPSGATVKTRTTTRPSGATVRTRSVDRPRGPDVRTRNVTRPSGATRTTVTRTAPAPRAVTFTGDRRRFAGTTARGWRVGRGTWVYGGRNYSYWRGGPYRVRYGNGWRTFVAVGLVAPIVVGAATYYPYAYLSAPADVCEGITEDGCQLTWTEVETVEGGTAPQCVTYCPWQN